MSEENNKQQLEGGAYEVIQARLQKQAGDLRGRLDTLNEERKSIFGAVEAALVSTERVTTEHNCTPRDLISIGNNRFIFGYNIQFGLKTTTDISDVFAAYDYDPVEHTFSQVPIESVLSDGAFGEDFQYLYKYYRETVFAKMMAIGPYLYMALKIGKEYTDIKTFKWLINGDGTLSYEGNRFDHEYVFPRQHEFDWKRCNRDMHRSGEHPHISIEDRVFVETVGGDLTIKIEDNTADGVGVYSEEVEDKDQSLDDSEIYFAVVGPLILLKILPYREANYRYFVFNEKTHSVERIDAIGNSCVLLPEDHGIIFANGYYLLSGELKTFDHGLTDMRFERRVSSANGEDTLFAFYNRVSGDYALLSYNLIEREVSTPVLCNGYSIFDNGELLYFKTELEAQKYHSIQIWQTPILSQEAVAAQQKDETSYLFKIGNAEIVAAMAECREILTLVAKDDNYGGLYIDLVKKSSDILDGYFWINRAETQHLGEPLKLINGAANSAIEEFDKVTRLRIAAKDRLADISERCGKILRIAEHSPPDDILGFVRQLSELRTIRGEIISTREMRYMDVEATEELEARVIAATEAVSDKTVAFLLEPESLDPYRSKVDEQKKELGKLVKVTEVDELGESLTESGLELEMLIDVVSNLKIEDSTQTTAIIDSISSIYSTLNGVKVELKNKRRDLSKSEGVAQFGSQMKLLSQAVVSYLDLCDTAEKTEGYLTKVMIQIEELEGKFSEFDDYVEELTTKREEVYNAFEGRKQQLLEKKSKRANTLIKSAERILSGIKNRVSGFKEINEINGYFAGDLMIEKVRDIISQLTELGDSVKADDIQTRLKTTREDAVRQLKDRNELYVDGKNIIQFGKQKFNVNTQELQLTVVPHEEHMCFHLSGTDYFERITDETFLSTRDVWDQEVISENKRVYRSEYLVYQMLRSRETLALLTSDDNEAGIDLLAEVQRFSQPRYAEAYTKGVHDVDAAKLLEAILPIHEDIGLLSYDPRDRALAILFWESWASEEKDTLAIKVASHGRGRAGRSVENHPYILQLQRHLESWVEEKPAAQAVSGQLGSVANYLFDQLCEDSETAGAGRFVVSPEAAEMVKRFRHQLAVKHREKEFDGLLSSLAGQNVAKFEVIQDLLGYIDLESSSADHYLPEAAAHILRGDFQQLEVLDVRVSSEVEGMIGAHGVVENGIYHLHYNEFMDKLRQFAQVDVPTFQAYQDSKHELVEMKRVAMRLDEFKPKVMSAFVRNKLLNNIYLPMIGDNLAKQLGTADKDTRTDRMGMLLLISPPGYGKTTIMEYIANRLGLTFMKINGPALGHDVVSLDPAEAPNATAKEEVKKLNLALEMGDNVLIYLDDIQHTHSEFLQKFISLCDAQRKIEGVYNGVARTYDLRGKKVAVVMAGNPYTETGGKFQIPDMLANRADTYNLGDIIGGAAEDFKASYIENSLTSNKVLSKLASKSQKDVYAVMQIAETGSQEGVDFEGNYTPAEIDEMVKVTKHLYRVRDAILRVNLQYIESAAQEDDYRTEPPFKLQGSYRNMNRIAEKIIPLMTDQEVLDIIQDHYENESQTLTSGAESNLLKFKEMEDLATPEEAARWESIKKDFTKNKMIGGNGEDDPVTRLVAQLTSINDSINTASSSYSRPQTLNEETIGQLEKIISGLRAVPVEVDINLIADQEDGVESMEKTSKKKGKKKSPIDIESETRQGEKQ
ncbi:MAG: DNA repair ATPase [Akkermansiaceae bacterium]